MECNLLIRRKMLNIEANGHNDFSDTNTIILCIEISDGVLFSHGKRYEI